MHTAIPAKEFQPQNIDQSDSRMIKVQVLHKRPVRKSESMPIKDGKTIEVKPHIGGIFLPNVVTDEIEPDLA